MHNDTHCTCPFDNPTPHVADDVVLVVAESLHYLAEELGVGDDSNWYAIAAKHFMENGITDWIVPRRQEHRAAQWLDACMREIRHYATNVQ